MIVAQALAGSWPYAAETSITAFAGTFAAPGGVPDQIGARRLVEAVRLLLVGAEERVDPPHAGVVVDLLDRTDIVVGQIELVGELSFDDEQRHTRLLVRRDSVGPIVGHPWSLIASLDP